jgi:ribosomal protein S1
LNPEKSSLASDDLAAVKIWNGKNVEGIVVEIHSHGVMVNIPCLPVSTKAYIHISQVSDGYIENFKTSFTVGQSVTVKVRFLRKDKTAWEVSRKAVLNEALWSNEFPEFSEAVGYVERIGDFGALVKLKDGFVGRISAFQLIFFPKDQQLEVGPTIEVRIGKWDFSGQCPLLMRNIFWDIG